MKLFVRSINTPRPPRVWSTDGEVHVSLDTDGTGLVMTPDEAAAFAVNLLAAADWPAAPEWTAVLDSLDTVNEAANDARHRGEYGKANKLVNARVTLYRAALANEEATAQGGA